MKHIFIFVLIISLFSCAAPKKNEELFSNYNLYVSKSKNNKSEFILSMLSTKRVKEINLLGKKQFPVLSEFPHVLFNIKGHYQKIEKNKGCLTVNGYGENNKPIILSIKYLYEGRKWGVDFVEIYYADSEGEFQAKAVCPSET